MILKELRVHGSTHADHGDLAEVIDLVRAGAVTPVPARRWPPAQDRDAHAALEARSRTGRAVLVP